MFFKQFDLRSTFHTFINYWNNHNFLQYVYSIYYIYFIFLNWIHFRPSQPLVELLAPHQHRINQLTLMARIVAAKTVLHQHQIPQLRHLIQYRIIGKLLEVRLQTIFGPAQTKFKLMLKVYQVEMVKEIARMVVNGVL